MHIYIEGSLQAISGLTKEEPVTFELKLPTQPAFCPNEKTQLKILKAVLEALEKSHAAIMILEIE